MAEVYKSDYVMRIVYVPTGEIVHQWAPGLEVETDFIVELCDRIRAKGIGIGRTEDHVMTDVKDAIIELLWDLKKRV